jgi:tRNA A-37 threonylcarbamoyl transferase component Bud32
VPRAFQPESSAHADSTRLVALARLPERLGLKSPYAPRPLTDYREFHDGEVVPGTRYRVASLIGAGGMGRVYEVEHVELGKRFVLKALQRELSRREDLVARLRNEWRALARLEHPNIVNVTDAGTSENGVPFYVMERLDGETLSMLMHRQRRLHPQQALAIAAGMLEGLHAAHQIGVVHRDVKPPNIFLVGPTAVKILDFGIAKIRDAKDVITARGIAVGTPRYMSPEQAQGTAVDARSDIYATGLILFEMVSGVGPFDDARDNNELLLAHLGRKAPLLSSISVVAPELDAVVASMLAKDPRERPADARLVAETLRALSQRYAAYPNVDTATVNAVRAAQPEVPTRVDAPRRASQPPAATRPDGVAARAAVGDTTALQPALEIATTAAHALPAPAPGVGATLRLDPSPVPRTLPTAAPLYGPDTLVDAVTSAPTAVPGPAPERTEMLLAVPLGPGLRAPTDPGPTRTSVPLAEAPNLTPPPVVPTASVPPPRPARSAKMLVVVAGGVVLLVAGVGLIWRSGQEAAPAAATRPVVLPSPVEPLPLSPPPAEPPSAEATRSAEVAGSAAPAAEPPLVAPSHLNHSRKRAASSAGAAASAPAAVTAEPAENSARAKAPRNKASVPMPGSGL